MTVVRVTTFNTDQFKSVEHQEADLWVRMLGSDVVLTQETVKVDLEKFAASREGWAAFQVRDGDNDGHANTGVLYRTSLGKPTATDCTFIGDVDGTRRRFLTAVQFNDREWYWAAHIFPKRDSGGIPAEVAAIGKWVKTHPGPTVGGLDRNQCPPGTLENATGLKWHGVGIDGFLTNCQVANVAEFTKGFSDHPGVHANVSIPAPKPAADNKVQQAGDLLRKAARNAKEQGRTGRLARIRAALHHLFGGK